MYDGMRFGDAEPTPFQKLARRILSICANSASCERLFSMFGIILTRLRSRLRAEALTNLAELRMHLRDEHIRNGTAKDRLRRKTTSHNTEEPSEDPEPPHSHSTQTVPENTSTANIESEGTPDTESESRSTSSFTNIVNRLIQQVEEDEDEDEVAPGNIHVKVANLFNYANRHWTRVVEKIAFRGLGEELELYELVELDADGELEPSDGVDSMTEATLGA